jgi:transcriptional regulator with XRE-family HTH domain
MGKKMGMSQAGYSKLEAGRVDATLGTLAKAREVMGLPPPSLTDKVADPSVEAALRTLAEAGYRVTLEALPAAQAAPRPQGEGSQS